MLRRSRGRPQRLRRREVSPRLLGKWLYAEVPALKLGVGHHPLRPEPGGEPPRPHHQLTIGHRRSHAEVLLDEQSPYAALAELADGLHQLLDDPRRESL